MLTPDEIDAMRAQQLEALPTQVWILRRTETRDKLGGTTHIWLPAAEHTGRIAAGLTGAARRSLGDKISERTTHTVTVPWDATVQSDDRVAIGTRAFSVLAIIRTEDWQTAMRLAVAEVR
jgi:head-tail adaptor